MPSPAGSSIIDQETTRLAAVTSAIATYTADRKVELDRHDALIQSLEKERLEVRSGWIEKNELTERLKEQSKLDPRKYLPPYEHAASPYFGIVGIADSDPKIGRKEYALGKQSLIVGTTALVVDWRKAQVSQFFYDYEEGEDYEIDIEIKGKTIEREGIITHKRELTVAKGSLRQIKSATQTFAVKDGKWTAQDGTVIETSVSSSIKSDNADHSLVDIVALIKPDQFAAITRQGSRYVYLTGGAGAGKTTVALHRASMLQFNDPERFRQTHTMVIVFNKTLKDYVKRTSKELLGETRIETFSSWALTALHALGCQNFEPSTRMNEYSELKKSSLLSRLLADFVKSTKAASSPIGDLVAFYRHQSLLSAFFPPNTRATFESHVAEAYNLKAKKPAISFSDMPILLRILQLRSGKKEIAGALRHFDHIVIDEAQDFSQVELEAILAAGNDNQSITMCADEKQKILNFVDAQGLAAIQMSLQKSGLDQTSFTVGYRSHPKIMDVANHVTAGAITLPPDLLNNEAVSFAENKDKDEALHAVLSEIREFQKRDPASLTAVITKGRLEIAAIHAYLKGEGGVANLHPAGQIEFTPGVTVINAHQVKGLEFTNVILWNPSAKNYKGNVEDRNLLYVAISRACKRLAIVGFERMTKWLR